MRSKVGKFFLKAFIFILISGIFVFLIFLVSNKKSEEQQKDDNLPVVKIQKPEIKDLHEAVTISGYVEAEAMIPIVPFVSGTITEYPVKAGEFVKKDTLLAKIDDASFKQQMLQAQAAYLVAESTFERVANLYKSGSTTKQNYDSAKAQRDASKAQYDLAQLQVGYTEVKASVDGTVLMADLAVGSVGTQSQPVAVLADLSNQVVRLKVPEKYFDLFSLERENLSVIITRPAEKDMYEDAVTTATIDTIAPYVSPQSKNFQVVCHLDDPGERFRPGMYVKVSVTYKIHKDASVMPLQVKKMDGSFYIYDEESKTVHYCEPVDSPFDDDYFIVPEQYKDKYFVTDGQNVVFDGQKVRLFDDVIGEY